MAFQVDYDYSPACPDLTLEDSTSYPASGTHVGAVCRLYLLTLTNLSDNTSTTYSCLSGVGADNVVAVGFPYNITVANAPDTIYKIVAYIFPVPLVGQAYSVDDCVTYNFLVYKCTTAGLCDNANPALSTDAIFVLIGYADAPSPYKVTTYAATLCNILDDVMAVGNSALATTDDCDCPVLCNNDDYLKYMKAMILLKQGIMEYPDQEYLSLLTFRNNYFSNITLLETLLA